MEPKKHIYSHKWTQPYTMTSVGLIDLEALKEMVIEKMLEEQDFKEADALIARVKAL